MTRSITCGRLAGSKTRIACNCRRQKTSTNLARPPRCPPFWRERGRTRSPPLPLSSTTHPSLSAPTPASRPGGCAPRMPFSSVVHGLFKFHLNSNCLLMYWKTYLISNLQCGKLRTSFCRLSLLHSNLTFFSFCPWLDSTEAAAWSPIALVQLFEKLRDEY